MTRRTTKNPNWTSKVNIETDKALVELGREEKKQKKAEMKNGDFDLKLDTVGFGEELYRFNSLMMMSINVHLFEPSDF